MKYIYLITSPSGKQYIGQSKVKPKRKQYWYSLLEYNKTTDRKIANAIRKYSWSAMKFEIIERNDEWSDEELNQREIFWISEYNSVNVGYNMTRGGEGVDSECARQNALKHHAMMTEEKKLQRSQNCSIGQKKRYDESPDSDITKRRKSDAHKGAYRIESPAGKIWITELGLKQFAEDFKNELNVTYWQLFSAYRKCYTATVNVKKRKDENNWKVTRLDK
jgi:hypothetical protein